MDPPMARENDGGELSSSASQENQNAQDPSVEVENREDDSSAKKSKDANGEESNIDIETVEKTKSSNAEQTTDKVEEVEISPIVDPVDETKNEETQESVPAIEPMPETTETPLLPFLFFPFRITDSNPRNFTMISKMYTS
ncbi:unnamed protein product [Lactuca virosa]|uniref:Uncharacterized protein n=1 Tax=Lactuca virosa TaxID=75947 RepID=A0AAU9MET1_9ASTR|nr:unnamed protein product [Lactuca virosa]